MLQRRGRLPAATATAALVAAALAGCTGSSDTPDALPSTASSGSSPSAESSPSPSADSSASAVPDPPLPPKARKGPEGQEAFARFVMEAWSWSLRTNDASPLLEVSPSRKQPCDGCRTLDRELHARAKEGWYVDFPGLTVASTRLRPAGDTVVATAKVAIPESDTYQDDGSYRSTSPAHEDATFTVTMRLTKAGYRLVSFSVG
jgi:hypothetical protein